MPRNLFPTSNIPLSLFFRILIVVFLYTLCRLVFLLLNLDYFEELESGEAAAIFFAGLRFDLAIIFLTNALYLFMFLLPFPFRNSKAYQRAGAWIFWIVNAAALLANCADAAYFPFSLKRTTADIFSLMAVDGGGDFLRLLPRYLLDFWYVMIIWALLVTGGIFLYRLTRVKPRKPLHPIRYYLLNTAWFLIGVVLCLGISRGGWQLRPLGIITAGQYTRGHNIPLVLNTPFTLIHTLGGEQIMAVSYFDDEAELNAAYSPLHHYHHPADSLKKLNVVVIILEGFSREYFGSMNAALDDSTYQGYCPFLDSLAQQGLNFRRAYSNGKRSIEGVPAVLAGFPNLMENPYITSAYAGNPINGIPYLLKKYGYSSAFFHGGTNGTMEFDAFTSLAGFEHYYGRSEYNNEADFDGNWGIFDEPFLQYTALRLNELPEPFVASVFTLSSHHPYTIPAQHRNRFPKGKLENHESIAYTDYALKQFFARCATMPWFSRTLFVVTTDHTAQTFSDGYKNDLEKFAVPLFYYRGDGSLRGTPETITQQADILPSVLDYLGYDGEFIAFGNSVFSNDEPHFSICFYNGLYQLITDELLLQFNGEMVVAAFDHRADPDLKTALDKNDLRVVQACHMLKAIIQAYNSRIIANELTVKP